MNVIYRKYGSFLLAFLLAATFAVAQDNPSEATEKQIQRLREEIARLQSEIDQTSKSEQTLQGKVTDLTRKIELKRKLSLELKQALALSKGKVKTSQSKSEIAKQEFSRAAGRAETAEQRLLHLREILREQAIHLYQYNRTPFWAKLLSGESLSNLLRKQRYVSIVGRAEGNAIAGISSQRRLFQSEAQELSQIHQQYRSELNRYMSEYNKQKKLQESAADQEQQLLADAAKQRKQIEQLRTDRSKKEELLRERQQAIAQIESIISRSIAARDRQSKEPTTTKPKPTASRQGTKQTPRPVPTASATRGAFAWPVKGPVVTRFGWQQGGAYGTTTESPGIEVKADRGTPVAAAAGGVVAQVTWLRGFGTTVILEHSGGTYTVYSHLGTASVDNGDVVNRGETIGTIGESEPGTNPTLHFEVWHRRAKQDPLNWLEPR